MEIARRKNKSFAQYTGVQAPVRPYRLGLRVEFFAGNRPSDPLQEMS